MGDDLGNAIQRCWGAISPVMWERRVGDVGDGMGFAGVRKSFSLVDRVHAELKVGEGEVEWIGYDGAARRSVGRPQTGVCVWGEAASLSRWCMGWS